MSAKVLLSNSAAALTCVPDTEDSSLNSFLTCILTVSTEFMGHVSCLTVSALWCSFILMGAITGFMVSLSKSFVSEALRMRWSVNLSLALHLSY